MEVVKNQHIYTTEIIHELKFVEGRLLKGLSYSPDLEVNNMRACVNEAVIVLRKALRKIETVE